jgi:hypothetical protein
MSMIYGIFDAESKSWNDGILPKIMRDIITSASLN